MISKLKSLIIALISVFIPYLAFSDTNIQIKVSMYYEPNDPVNETTQIIMAYHKEHPKLDIQKWSGITLPSNMKSTLMMSIAGNTAPDIGQSWSHIIRQEISQGFLYPLNEWIGDDLNGDGYIDDEEAKWDGWRDVPEIMRRIATIDGKVYGIPEKVHYTLGIVYRTDLVEAAGLDPKNPPKTWSEFYDWCKRLTDPGRKVPGTTHNFGQRAFMIQLNGHAFLPWLESAGGEAIVQYRKSPNTGKLHRFSQNETAFITPDGENLSKIPSQWRCELDTPEAMRALAFYHLLRWGKWQSGPNTITGVCRNGLLSGASDDLFEMLGKGEVVMAMVNRLEDLTNLDIDPSLLAWMPYPADDGMPLCDIHGKPLPMLSKGRRTVQRQNHFIVMYPDVGKRPKHERDAIWEVAKVIGSQDVVNKSVEARILQGLGRFVPPSELKRLGYNEYIRDIPAVIRDNYAAIESGEIQVGTEPWSGFWYNIDFILKQDFGIMLGSRGEDWDYVYEMTELSRKASSGIMFKTPEEVIARYRKTATAILFLVIITTIYLTIRMVKSHIKKDKIHKGSSAVHSSYLPILLILPAVLLILIWGYYPLIRGLIMAFQDYKITGKSTFIGMDNFINLAIDPSFWRSLKRTIYYVLLHLGLAFTAPIFLSILLSEIRHAKIFFRTLFFLPQMTSGLVITLMWKLMYAPTPAGFFNQLITLLNNIPFINIAEQSYLEDPQMAMLCCIIPQIWAGMGIGSLLYIAALHSVPPDLYEAADIDGAGVRDKLIHITIPTLLPLILINFVGTFITTFQSMGNILLLTFGGPGEATTVIGLRIWQEAYVNLRFGMATAMACLLGTLLIGLTYIQIKFLGRVEYRRASE